MEFDFPEFEALKGYAYDIVNSNVVLTNEISDLLTVMALDNEGENLLEYIEEHSSNEQLNMIVEVGVSHLQPAARWQIAELICRRKPENYLKYLSVLSEDSHSYVRQRAQNCIEYSFGGLK